MLPGCARETQDTESNRLLPISDLAKNGLCIKVTKKHQSDIRKKLFSE